MKRPVEKAAASKGTIKAISVSKERGTQKYNVPETEMRADLGIVGDAHAGDWHRQVSLLAMESVNKMVAKGARVSPGDFAENITTLGVVLHELPVGTRLFIGDTELEVTQIGKKCHADCEILKLVGDCIMPRRGIFAKVRKGGTITHESIGYYHI